MTENLEMFDIIRMSNGQYKIFVYDSIPCQRLNRSLRTYPKETDFVAEKSEGIFRAEENQLKHVLAVLKS